MAFRYFFEIFKVKDSLEVILFRNDTLQKYTALF